TGDLNLGKVALYQLSYSRFTTSLLPFPWSPEPSRLRAPPQPYQGCALPTELFPLYYFVTAFSLVAGTVEASRPASTLSRLRSTN
ncbi:MAG: hypothetical protein NWQ24_09580, partial [Haliea sp.]|nr:hypothetical protein [Haliea sp.]